MARLDSTGKSVEIGCTACSGTNRIPLRRLRDGPVCGRCRQRLSVHQPLVVTDATFDTLVQEAAVPVLVDFWAPWCGPCRMVAPELEKLASEKRGELLVAKLNSDENPQTSSRFNIRSIPTLLLFREGQEARRLMGAMRAPEILSQLGL